jgi:uncharacterized protein YqjF (DUF2071 family)
MHPSLKSVRHRPWALPEGPWVMAQNWHDLLFAHWQVPVGKIRELVPRGLEIDTFAGRAWIGVVPFRMSGVRLRGMPALPGLAAFPELNVRTYVRAGDKPGVWFFSLDAANRVAVEAARAWFYLPYFYARMTIRGNGKQLIYACERNDRRGNRERLEATYEPLGECFHARPGSLERFLTERYCLYALRPDLTLLRAEIHHAPWSLQAASAEFVKNAMTEGLGLELEGAPLLYFSKLQEVVVWAPRPVPL